jgi:hypothetical protein
MGLALVPLGEAIWDYWGQIDTSCPLIITGPTPPHTVPVRDASHESPVPRRPTLRPRPTSPVPHPTPVAPHLAGAAPTSMSRRPTPRRPCPTPAPEKRVREASGRRKERERNIIEGRSVLDFVHLLEWLVVPRTKHGKRLLFSPCFSL